MGITWCRERLEQAQNAKNPVDRILIRCSNAMKPKAYFRSQDRLADDIVYRGVRKDNLQTAPPRSRARPHAVEEWQAGGVLNGDLGEDLGVAPVPPPRKKRKRRLNGDAAVNGSQELLSQGGKDGAEDGESIPGNHVDSSSKAICNGEEDHPPSNEQRRQNRFVKLSENRGGASGRTRAESQSRGGDGETAAGGKKREQKMKVVKNVSTVSLPNYSELVKPSGRASAEGGGGGGKVDDKTVTPSGGGGKPPPPRRNQSTISLPGEGSKPILSSLSEATIHRLETYMKRCRSFGSLKPQQLLEKLEEFNKTNRSESESSDSWSGLDDWDLGVIEYCDPETANVPPLTPKSTLPPRNKKIFSVGTPHDTPRETPRRQSPVSEGEEPVEGADKPAAEEEGQQQQPRQERQPPFPSVMTPDSVPSDWFSESHPADKLEVDGEQARTPPPSPANGLAETETVIENDESQSSLLEILTKYKDEEMSDIGSMRRESSTGESLSAREEDGEPQTEDGGEEEETSSPPPPERKLVRHRSRSLIETNPALLHMERFVKRSPSIGFERTTRLLDELTRNSEAIEKELLSNPEQVLNGLRRASMYEHLPEDPFEVYISRKKPSLRESLSVFLGFNRENGPQGEEQSAGRDRSEPEEKSPPPLPTSPPPSITMSPPESTDAPRPPLVTVTGVDDSATK